MEEIPESVSKRYQEAEQNLNKLEQEIKDWGETKKDNWDEFKKGFSDGLEKFQESISDLFNN